MNPAAVTTSDAVMNGHFHFRKSKFVFLNNSIEPVLPASRWLSSRWFYSTSKLDTNHCRKVPYFRRARPRQVELPYHKIAGSIKALQMLSVTSCFWPPSST